MSLTSITFGDFLVVMRSDFDVNIYGEPYHAITLLYNVDTRQYLARYGGRGNWIELSLRWPSGYKIPTLNYNVSHQQCFRGFSLCIREGLHPLRNKTSQVEVLIKQVFQVPRR